MTRLAFHFDHINVQAGPQSPLQSLFGDVMSLAAGGRPPRVSRHLLYGGEERALLHVIEAPTTQGRAIRLDHVTFRSDEPADAVPARLRAAGLPYEVNVIPRDGDVQVFVPLPGGLVVELDLPADGRDAPEVHATGVAS